MDFLAHAYADEHLLEPFQFSIVDPAWLDPNCPNSVKPDGWWSLFILMKEDMMVAKVEGVRWQVWVDFLLMLCCSGMLSIGAGIQSPQTFVPETTAGEAALESEQPFASSSTDAALRMRNPRLLFEKKPRAPCE